MCSIVLFLFNIVVFQNVEVYKTRDDQVYGVVQKKQVQQIKDESTPLGIKTEYSWQQGEVLPTGSYLAFGTTHQFAEVYFDDELVYRISLQDKDKVGKTPAANWVMIPLYPEDEGKQIRVHIIPVYEDVIDRTVQFYTGSKYLIYFNQLKKDLPQMILSIGALIIGTLFITLALVYDYRKKEKSDLLNLGIFSCALGVWKLTDIRFAPLMFPQNPVALTYISISMILIGLFPWTLSFKKQFLRKSYPLLDWSMLFSGVVVLVNVVLQITNIADLRETLWATQLVVILTAVVTVGLAIWEVKEEGIEKQAKPLYISLIFCVVGVVLDITIYYIDYDAKGMLYTVSAFLIYIISMGLVSMKKISHRANIDTHTGVFNKSRCNEMLDETTRTEESVAIMMFDLNGLKQVNDTLGHEAGDLLIETFAHIIRKKVYKKAFVGRYGGDEFIVVTKDIDKQSIQQVLSDIAWTVENYNKRNDTFVISYASGYALSDDYPDATLRELLKEADEKMYSDKRAYQSKKKVI